MTVNYSFNERVISHSLKWLINWGKWLLSLWMAYWIIDSLDSFKNVGSYSIETLLRSMKHKPVLCCDFDWNFASELSQKQSILYYKLWTLCLLHSQWRTSMPVCAVKMDRLGGSAHEMRWVRFEAAPRRRLAFNIKVPQERFEHMRSHLLSVSLVVLWCQKVIGLCGDASSWTEKGSNTLLSTNLQFLSLSLSLCPPTPQKGSLDLDNSHKWHILIQNGEFRWKATSLQVWIFIWNGSGSLCSIFVCIMIKTLGLSLILNGYR